MIILCERKRASVGESHRQTGIQTDKPTDREGAGEGETEREKERERVWVWVRVSDREQESEYACVHARVCM